MARYGFAFYNSGVRYGAPANLKGTMRDLHRFLENPFDDPGISIAELLAFSTDHSQRMIANNATGDFTARITATTSALDLCGTQFGDDETKLGLRKARKQAKDTYRKTLPATMAKLCAAVVAQYGDKSPEMTECCPQGRAIFSSCTDDAVSGHLQTFITGVTAHQADLGAPLVTQAQGVLTAWNAIYTASESATGAKTGTQDSKNAAHENLQLMLFLNLLKIAEVFARQPEKLDLYMQQSLLADRPQHPATPPPPTPPSP